jgi:hypothetical protein
MAGLKTWFDQKWVDIGSKRKDGSFAKCGRSKQKKDAKRKYPKCVPLAKATRMTESQRASAVKRKREGVGGKPTNVATFAKRSKKADGGSVGNSMIKQAQRDYKGSYISGSLGGVKVGNPSYKKYYKGML